VLNNIFFTETNEHLFEYTYKLKRNNMLKIFLQKHLLKIAGIVTGAIGGYLYYHFVGCQSGTCPITSNPYISVIYGALMGYLLFDLFKKKETKEHGNN
jgi:uncharacterized protein YacL